LTNFLYVFIIWI